MFDIDFEKIRVLKDKHWAWFWYRAGEKKISVITKSDEQSHQYTCREFWRIYFNWDKTIIENIIFSSKEEMINLVDEKSSFFQKFQANLFWLKNYFVASSHDNMESLIYDSFGYNNFIKEEYQSPKNAKWGAYVFVKALGVDVCPYCGRNYIFTIGDGDNKKGRPEIDHFIPEKEYPFFSCSLYNFIPSCHQCNHQKHDDYNKKKNGVIKWIPYPYIEPSKGEMSPPITFRAFYKIKDNKLVYGVRIRKKGAVLSEEFKNANNAFHLKDLYECHEIEMNDLFSRYRNYRNHKIREIISLFHKTTYININNFIFAGKLKKMILGLPIYKENKEYPLKKFKEDIIEQLDCMKK